MTRLFLYLACCSLFITPSWVSARSTDHSRPNIVLIISDDQAWSDYGFMGHPEIATPHLDQLAQNSLLFKRGYVAAPICRPSLASIVTGLSPSQHGITGNDVDAYNNRPALDRPLRRRFYEHESLVRFLVSRGYLALQTGKWWEGSYQEGGFTHGMTHGDPKRKGRHGDEGLAIGRKGIDQIDQFIDHALSEEKPFFVWYAPFLPHTPHNPPQELLDKYTQPGRKTDVAKYYAMCEWFDATCGNLLQTLDDRGIAEDTLVLYIADNGWAAKSTNESHPYQNDWKVYAQQSKGSPYENGIRSPIMVSWPGHIAPRLSDSLAHATDFFPTIADAIDAPCPNHLTGISLLDDDSVNSRKRVFGVTHATHNMTIGVPDQTLQYVWCIDRRWKLIERHAGLDTTRYSKLHAWDKAPYHLYDLLNDPHERIDLATEHPDVVKELAVAIAKWRASLADAPQSKDPPTPDMEVVYKSTPQGKLTLHGFRPPGHNPDSSCPAIIFFFGGGWNGGSPSQFYPQCDRLAAQGIFAFSAEYRVASRHKTSPRECVMDGKSAIRWLRTHASELGVDPNKILAGGGSAGGHVAAACGTLPTIDDPQDDLSVSPIPAALILFNPVFDNGPGGYGHQRVADYWQDFSPLHNIDNQTPPTVVFLGKKDPLIPEATALKYQQAMEAAGGQCLLHLFAEQKHGFFNYRSRNYYEATMDQTEQFLTELGFANVDDSPRD